MTRMRIAVLLLILMLGCCPAYVLNFSDQCRNATSPSINKDFESDVDYFEASVNLKVLF